MELVFPPAGARTVPGVAIEVVSGREPGGWFRSVLFDFDGTLSVIREGWQQVMIPSMVEELRKTGTAESDEELTSIVTDYVDRLTGKDTIYQMIRLVEEIRGRGCEPSDPYIYKRKYLDRLWEKIKDRVEGLKSGAIRPEEMVIEGSFDFLEGLESRGMELYLASGTDDCYVRDEASALRLDRYFGDNIFGAVDRSREHSKARIIREIIESRGLGGDSLLVIGDGFVEMENCRAVGGFAVGVASDEVNRMGLNEWKRNRLSSAGADIIVTDYRDHERLLQWLFDREGMEPQINADSRGL